MGFRSVLAVAFVVGVALGIVACGLELGGERASGTTPNDDGSPAANDSSAATDTSLLPADGDAFDAGPVVPSDGGPIEHTQTWQGGSTILVTVSTNVAAGTGLYLAAVSSKTSHVVAAVTGMGASWTRVRTQCGGRDQSMVDLFTTTSPPFNGAVTATFVGIPLNAVITVTRYANATRIGGVATANAFGPNGKCSDGVDSKDVVVSVPQSANGRVYGAAAVRHRGLTPGNNIAKHAEVHQGLGGDVAGLAVIDTSGPTLQGQLDGDGTDWAIVGVELLP